MDNIVNFLVYLAGFNQTSIVFTYDMHCRDNFKLIKNLDYDPCDYKFIERKFEIINGGLS